MPPQILANLFEDMRHFEWKPIEWEEDKMTLIHKNSGKSNFDNYRGTSISNSLQKLYSRILEQRLGRLVAQEGWLSEMQGGFRDNRSTIDQLFILSSILERARALKKKTFFAFIDFKKVFDSIPR